MSDDPIEHWKALARQVGIERSGRDLKRARIAKGLDWNEWSQEEREVYAAAFLFPAPAEPLIDGITIEGQALDLKRLARTSSIVDGNGDIWIVVEHGKPRKLA